MDNAAELLSTQTRTERFFKENLVGQALHSAAYAAVETPSNAIAQLAGREQPLGLISAPQQAEFGTTKWYAQTAGSAVGMAVPFLAAAGTTKLAGRGLMSAGESFAFSRSATITVGHSQAFKAATPFLHAASTGAVAEGILRPTDPTKGDAATQRLGNAFVGAATFTTLVAGNKLLKGVDAKYVSPNSPWAVNTWKHDVLRHTLAGGGAGLVNAELHALVSDGRHATGKELYQSAYTFALLGGSFRAGGELYGRANGTRSVSDVVSQDRSLQDVMRGSEQAKNLLIDYGDARVATPTKLGGGAPEPSAFLRAGDLASVMAMAEARANVAAGKRWEDVMKEKIAGEPEGAARIRAAYADFAGKLPETNWEQARYGLVRERAFLNDLLNQHGNVPELSQLSKNWNSRWAAKIDPAQELAARMSRTFNANDQDAAGKEQYQHQMRTTADAKTGVVAEHVDPQKYQTVVDIGAAEGQVPNNLALRSDGRTTAFAVDLDPGSILKMLEARRQSMASGDNSFLAIPVFADGVGLKLPSRSINAFSSLSNIHELVSYPRQFYGQFRPENARLAVSNWAHSLTDGGKIVIKDFLRPEEMDGKVLLVPKKVEAGSLTHIEGKPIAPEYQSGTPGQLWVQEFTGETPWRSSTGPQTIRFGGKDFNVEWVNLLDGTKAMKVDARSAAEIMASARYGMLEQRTQMEGVTHEQFVNFTKDGWTRFMHGASPFGSRLNLVVGSERTKAGSDYVQHRQHFFELRDPQGRPINLSESNPAWHTTYQGAFQKAPGSGRPLLDLLGRQNGSSGLGTITGLDRLMGAPVTLTPLFRLDDRGLQVENKIVPKSPPRTGS